MSSFYFVLNWTCKMCRFEIETCKMLKGKFLNETKRRKRIQKLLNDPCIVVCLNGEDFWLRQELKKYKSPSVCSMKVCLELLIFFFLAQVSFRLVLGLSALSFSSARFFHGTDTRTNAYMQDWVVHAHAVCHTVTLRHVTSRPRYVHVTSMSRPRHVHVRVQLIIKKSPKF